MHRQSTFIWRPPEHFAITAISHYTRARPCARLGVKICISFENPCRNLARAPLVRPTLNIDLRALTQRPMTTHTHTYISIAMRLFSGWLSLAGSFSTLRAPPRAVAMKNFVPPTHPEPQQILPLWLLSDWAQDVCVCVGKRKKASASFPSGVRWRIRFVGPHCHFAARAELIKMQIKLPRRGADIYIRGRFY